MIEACRVIESQSRLYAEQATTSYDEARYLESILELIKPPQLYAGWHPLISTPFRYPLPVGFNYQARFRPPFYPQNVLYGSRELEPALYEHAYHFLLERVHANMIRESGQRTAFTFYISATPTDIRKHPSIQSLMNRHDYTESHAYILKNPADVLLYPSCRDPHHGDNFAVFKIDCLEKDIGTQRTLAYYYDPTQWAIVWMDSGLAIHWDAVH